MYTRKENGSPLVVSLTHTHTHTRTRSRKSVADENLHLSYNIVADSRNVNVFWWRGCYLAISLYLSLSLSRFDFHRKERRRSFVVVWNRKKNLMNCQRKKLFHAPATKGYWGKDCPETRRWSRLIENKKKKQVSTKARGATPYKCCPNCWKPDQV